MTQDNGLKDLIACHTRISSIQNDHLSYAGYDISELIDNQASFEETIYLLWNLRLPTAHEYQRFTDELRTNYAISDAVEQCILIQSRKHLHPMSVLRSTVSLLGVYNVNAEQQSLEATYEQSIQLMAKIPTIIATFARLRNGQTPIAPRKDLDFAENFLYMLTGQEPLPLESQALNKSFILHADHELNASTFAARVCASTLSDIYSCVTTAIGTLKGPLHGGANERVFDMLQEIRACGDTKAYLQEKLDSQEKIMGFGHRVYKQQDPRESYLRQMAKELTQGTEQEVWYQLSREIEDYMKHTKGLIPNVDFYSATVYHVLGIDSSIFTLIFAMSRVAGWIAHIQEQQRFNKLIRPRSHYLGPENLSYIPLERRGYVS
ncbi:citrate synthase [Streptococcus azizii]|uniref:Citrate synthase n=1 Tax=Streptococcus azizii TaxID=1579424 RepID=A0AB36JPH7_9STRE|nr:MULTISPECIES: citrate synthase [Streptococcus]MBF0775204.1 citrate synthase [Streptococcus sp. 19428wD3_AN2]ONK29482.1 citrate synthase [Streptococcus azizii]ONK29990.1 citrate synthase [Streptococcus azizii]ONK30767.1 citrate synthase [Streptococcus azizii]TFU84733.1 citrate synthase [Streptococcus sp. AN2]